jgi:predicted nucleic acid-binding protein
VEHPVLYLDSMVFIYAVEGDEDTAPPARQLMDVLRQKPGAAVTSELSLAEVLAPTSRDRSTNSSQENEDLPSELKRQVYSELMISSGFVNLIPVSRDILLETTTLRLTQPQKLPDAIHAATAIEAGCRYFVSADRRVRLPGQLARMEPNRGNLAGLIEAVQ